MRKDDSFRISLRTYQDLGRLSVDSHCLTEMKPADSLRRCKKERL